MLSFRVKHLDLMSDGIPTFARQRPRGKPSLALAWSRGSTKPLMGQGTLGLQACLCLPQGRGQHEPPGPSDQPVPSPPGDRGRTESRTPPSH